MIWLALQACLQRVNELSKERKSSKAKQTDEVKPSKDDKAEESTVVTDSRYDTFSISETTIVLKLFSPIFTFVIWIQLYVIYLECI